MPIGQWSKAASASTCWLPGGGSAKTLEQVLSPVTVWHGREDTFVPWRHAEWLADRLPNAELHLLDGEGHISLVSHYGASLDALLALGR
jgi:pimeloyl-ACP methyl ester carboxylesterase